MLAYLRCFCSVKTAAKAQTLVLSCGAPQRSAFEPLQWLVTTGSPLKVGIARKDFYCERNSPLNPYDESRSMLYSGSHGASKHVQLIAFPTVSSAMNFLRTECRCTNVIGLLGAFAESFSSHGYDVVTNEVSQLVPLLFTSHLGIEQPSRRSFPVTAFPFPTGNTCLVFGRSAQGLGAAIAEPCTAFVHVPHERVDDSDKRNERLPGTTDSSPALLDAQSSLSIVLHHWTRAAQYEERCFSGHKFAVASVHSQSVERQARQQLQDNRRQLKCENDERAEEALSDGWLGLFGES